MSTVAQTILEQLGGNRFIAMTGARHFVSDVSALMFKLPKKYNGINHVSVTLEANDTYTVRFLEVKRGGLDFNERAVCTLVYGDQLRAVFTEQTGLATSL